MSEEPSLKIKEEKVRLKDVTKLIRSKNAGPFLLTFDILFDDVEMYSKVRDSGVINKELIAIIYKVDVKQILLVNCDNALAIKITIPRPVVCGDVSDTDIYGGQQYALLIDLEIPD